MRREVSGRLPGKRPRGVAGTERTAAAALAAEDRPSDTPGGDVRFNRSEPGAVADAESAPLARLWSPDCDLAMLIAGLAATRRSKRELLSVNCGHSDDLPPLSRPRLVAEARGGV